MLVERNGVLVVEEEKSRCGYREESRRGSEKEVMKMN